MYSPEMEIPVAIVGFGIGITLILFCALLSLIIFNNASLERKRMFSTEELLSIIDKKPKWSLRDRGWQFWIRFGLKVAIFGYLYATNFPSNHDFISSSLLMLLAVFGALIYEFVLWMAFIAGEMTLMFAKRGSPYKAAAGAATIGVPVAIMIFINLGGVDRSMGIGFLVTFILAMIVGGLWLTFWDKPKSQSGDRA